MKLEDFDRASALYYMEASHIIRSIDAALQGSGVDEVGFTLDPALPEVVHMDGKLGIAKRCLKATFKHALIQLYQIKEVMRLNAGMPHVVEDALSTTRIVLLIKGDYPVAYEIRKSLIENGQYNPREDIPLTSLVFMLHPKCPSGWQHRRWCLLRCTGQLPLTAAQLETERELCRDSAEKHPKNYYAWLHRLWLLQFMLPHQLDDELTFTAHWLHSHVSDHSAVNHRVQVLVRILASPPALQYVMDSEGDPEHSGSPAQWESQLMARMLEESTGQLTSRPGHESLWYLRRSLWEMLLSRGVATFGVPVPVASAPERIAQDDLLSVQHAPPVIVEPSVVAFIEMDDSAVKYLGRGSCMSAQAGSYSGRWQAWLKEAVSAECALVARCCDESQILWDSATQRRMALRYQTFCLQRARWYHARVVVVEREGDVEGGGGGSGAALELWLKGVAERIALTPES